MAHVSTMRTKLRKTIAELGMGSALETLCGQAFGAGQIHMLGIYTQRSVVILLCSTFLLLPIYIFATPVLKLLGQEHDIADLAAKFVLLSIPELFSLAVAIPTSKFLQARSKVGVLAYIGFVALLLHALLLWLFIYVFNLGVNGAALAFNVKVEPNQKDRSHNGIANWWSGPYIMNDTDMFRKVKVSRFCTYIMV